MLSFVTTQDDPASTVQKNLIDAAVQAGVKRFAPSEWSTWAFLNSDINPSLTSCRSGLEHLSWYAYKAETRRYLKELNQDKKVSCEEPCDISKLTQDFTDRSSSTRSFNQVYS